MTVGVAVEDCNGEADGDGVTVTGFDSAFRSAGLSGADYFLIVQSEESDRTFSASATLYLSRTGASVPRPGR